MVLNHKACLTLGASLVALGLSMACQMAFAQDVPQEEQVATGQDDKPDAEHAVSKDVKPSPAVTQGPAVSVPDIVVVGTRQALETSKEVKRNAENVVDSITANDVGALPDKSVAEALQRVPGVTVSRFASANDTQHFSAEPSGVLVRGLEQVRSEFNGRDTFSADSSRGLGWEDITPELMQRIDVYKNQSADLIEGGISGLVDLHTRLPFDFKGQSISMSAEGNYSEIAKSWNPNISGMFSDRFETGIGDIGFLIQGAFSKLDTRSEGIYLGRMGIYEEGSFEGVEGKTYIPTFITARDNLYSRERRGVAAAVQWENNARTLLATVQYNRSNYKQVNTEYSSLNWIFALWGQKANYVIPKDWVDGAKPLPGQSFTFGEDGAFESGYLTSGLGWWGATPEEAAAGGANSNGIPLVNPNGCGWATTPEYTSQYCDEPYDRRGVGEETNSRKITENSMTQDVSFNLKWTPSSRFKVNLDAQYVNATKRSYGAAAALQTYTGMTADFSGSLPKITYSDPLNVNFAEGGLSNPNAWSYAWIQDHRQRNRGDSYAIKADGEYSFDSNWLASLKFGARFVDREQVVRQAWNFRGITSRWESAAYYNADKTSPIAETIYGGQPTFFAGYPDPSVTLVNHVFRSGYMGGGVMDSSPHLYINPELLGNLDQLNQYFSRQTLGIGDFYPICSAAGPSRSAEIIGPDGESTCFTPGETLNVRERIKSAYMMMRFGGKNAELFNTGITISGNIGVRFVETRTQSKGSITFNTFTASQLDCFENRAPTVVDPENPYIPPSTPYSAGCYIVGAARHNAEVPSMPDMIDDGNGNMIANPRKVLLPDYIVGSPDDLLFHNGNISPVVGDKTYRNWLPSVNIKLDLGNNTIMRFAYSKAMSRPDMSLFRYAADLGQPGPDISYAAQCKQVDAQGNVTPIANCTPLPELTLDSQGRLIAAQPRYQANTGNPFIKPITANNFDVTFEHYWRGIGQFSVDVFYKKFYNYITYGTSIVPITNEGVTRNLYINGPLNGKGASVKGFEANFQTFLDFLPSPWNGFGVQANYTRLINSGVDNVNYDSGSDYYLKTDRLQGMSDHSYNLILMYEKGPIGLRAAYNWRSKYLVTANDCCNLPVWQDSQGFLDGSIRYRLNDKIEMSMQVSNILNSTTHLLQQVTSSDDPVDPNHLVPTAWFKSDRRYSFGIRSKF